MTVIADFLAAATTLDNTVPRVGGDRSIVGELSGLLAKNGDFDYPSGYDAVNEVQQITAHVAADGGTYTLTFLLKSGETFTTGNIAFGANAATIETAIDVAATAASVIGWTNGDISVTGGPLSTTTAVFTYDGASVAGLNHGQVSIDDALLLDGVDPGEAGTASSTTQGHDQRSPWALLKALGIITSTPPAQGADLSWDEVTVGNGRGQYPFNLSAETVLAICEEAGVQDGNETVYPALKRALGY